MKKIVLILVIIAMSVGISAWADGEKFSWDCACGAKGNTGNFCPNCGSQSPAWICPECGSINTQNFCPNCGSAKQAAIESNGIQVEENDHKKTAPESENYSEEYKHAIQLIDENVPEKFIEACNILKELKSVNYPGASDKLNETYTKMLGKGKYAYYKGDYISADKYLKYLKNCNYSDEAKLYYTLNYVRTGNYCSRSSYRMLLNHIDEANTKEVIVCNQLVAIWFLAGEWKSENGYTMIFSGNSVLTGSLSSVISGEKHYWIEDGNLYVYKDSLNEKVIDKKIEIQDANTIKVYNYADDQNYKMVKVE